MPCITLHPSLRTDSPDAPGVGPVTAHSGGQQQRGHGLVEQEVIIDQLLLFLVRHVPKGVVLSFQVSVQGAQAYGENNS